jgi:hypothetical protein
MPSSSIRSPRSKSSSAKVSTAISDKACTLGCSAPATEPMRAATIGPARSAWRSVAGAMLRHRGSFDGANATMASALAPTRSPADLLADFRRLSREPEGLGRYFPSRLFLGDHVTHELDMVLALGREPQIRADVSIAVLNTQVTVPNPFVPAFRNASGLRLRATDAAWTHRTRGPVVEGRADELVSVLGNRPKMLPRLRGDGVVVLEARLSVSTRMAG